MKKIKVNLGVRSYNILIGWRILKTLSNELKRINVYKDIFVITNSYLKNKYSVILKNALKKGGFSVEFFTTIDSEKAKSVENALKLIETIARAARQKKIAILAFGGGVIGDLSGFIASIYKRGVPLISLPTTLLAQIDSSIGGKTAIDLKIAKNLIGTFYQPSLVFSDLSILETLNRKQIRSGLAEAIKYAIIKDEKLFEYLERNYQSILSCNPESIEHLVTKCASIKAKITELDEKEEKGIRTILNFGHTVGHAIEAAGGYTKFNHGEAISMGMLCAAKISQSMHLMTDETYKRIFRLIANIGLPQEIAGIKEKEILATYKLDKKFIGKTNRFVLINKIGSPVVYKNVPERIIHNALKELLMP